MRYLEFREARVHGTQSFPFAYYRVSARHPRYHMVDHWHTEYELLRVVKGRLALTINGTLYKGVPGDIFFISEGMLHSGAPESCVYECLLFDLPRMAETSPMCSQAMAPLLQGLVQIQKSFGANDSQIAELTGQAMDAMRLRGPGFELSLLGSMYQLLALALHQYAHTDFGNTVDAKQLARFKDVLRFIRAHYSESVTLEELAAVAHMSKRYFCRYFREMTQKTPVEYLNYYRIECACEQLKTTEKNVSEIAGACGFNDISYFIRVFKKFKGLTPLQYTRAGAKHK